MLKYPDRLGYMKPDIFIHIHSYILFIIKIENLQSKRMYSYHIRYYNVKNIYMVISMSKGVQ